MTVKHAKRASRQKIRPIQFAFFTNADEREYIARETFAIRSAQGDDLSQNDLVIKRVMKPGWRKRLAELRVAQARLDQKEVLGTELAHRLRSAR